MITTRRAFGLGKLAFVVLALALTLSATGCATPQLGSHGVDYSPPFNPSVVAGGGGGGR
jgi:hypothetical protein